MPVALIARILRSVPSIGCVKEKRQYRQLKIRQLRDIHRAAHSDSLRLGALYAPFDLEAGSDGFNTGFAFPEVLIAMVAAARAQQWARVHELYSRFAALIVFEQQPGVAVRKEVLRRRGLLASSHARHPGASISSPMAAQLESLLSRTLPGVDITRPIAVDDVVVHP